MLTNVSFSVFAGDTKGIIVNGVTSDQSNKNKNLIYEGKFQWIFYQGKWNVVWVRREFKSSEFELTK